MPTIVSCSAACTLAARSACPCANGSSSARGGTKRAKSIGRATKPPSPSWCIDARICGSQRGVPYDASAITLYSSELRMKPTCIVSSS